MKEKIEIIKYTKIDENLDNIIFLHRNISKMNKLHNNLIYFDDNFPNFITKNIRYSQNDLFFVLKSNDYLEGFLHFKKLENEIFLNNISLSQNVSHQGLGKILLRKSLELTNLEGIKFFGLDVLDSNQFAYNWYKKLGLKVINNSQWISITRKNSITPTKYNLNYKKDCNGFSSIYYDENKIGTIINNRTLIINNLGYIQYLPIENFFTIAKIDLEEKYDLSNYDNLVLEKNYRMRGDINIVLSQIN